MTGVMQALHSQRDLAGILSTETLRTLKTPRTRAVSMPRPAVSVKAEKPENAPETVQADLLETVAAAPVAAPAKAKKTRKARNQVSPDQLGFNVILAAPEQPAPAKSKRTRTKRVPNDAQYTFAFPLEDEITLPDILEAATEAEEDEIAAIMTVVLAEEMTAPVTEEAAQAIADVAAFEAPVTGTDIVEVVEAAAAVAPAEEPAVDTDDDLFADTKSYLTPERELALATRWVERGDIRARDTLVLTHEALCHKIAKGYAGYLGRGIEYEDMVGQGQLGLLVASERYNPSYGVRFANYAAWWVRASMTDYVLANWTLVHIGTSDPQKKLFFAYRRLKNQISQAEGHLSTDEIEARIAEITKTTVAQVRVAGARLGSPVTSMNAPVSAGEGEGCEFGDLLADNGPTPEDEVVAADTATAMVRILGNAMSALNERERYIVTARHLSEEQATLESLSDRFGISRERIRQICDRALEKIRLAIEASMPDAADAIRHLLAA